MKEYTQRCLYHLFLAFIPLLFCLNTSFAGTYVYDDKNAAQKSITVKVQVPSSSEKDKNKPSQAPAGKPYDHKKNQKGPNK